MFIIKNPIETAAGHIQCVLENGATCLIAASDEYEIHESSAWEDVKPCPQAEKDAYAIEQANAAILAELATLDATPRLLEEAALGDEYAINKLRELKERKDALRANLK